jgi:uncharacterized membrane protein (DUF373 family)
LHFSKQAERAMIRAINKFEKVITLVLIGMMAFVIVLSIVDLAWLLIKDILSSPAMLLDTSELLEIFGTFLLVLIGIELIETIKTHHENSAIRAEVIILVAIIALARKIITLDFKVLPGGTLLGIAALVLALGATYHLIKYRHLYKSL